MGTFLNSILILCVICVQQQTSNGDPSKISPELSSLLEKGGTVNVIVSFGGIQPALEKALATPYANRKLQVQAIVDNAKDHTDKSQASVLLALSARSDGDFKYFKQYWVSNKLFIKEASASIVKVIAKDPKVSKITKEPIAELPIENKLRKEATYGLPDYVPSTFWNIERIEVKKAWEELGGKKGDGVVVGTIDTGARYTHEALRDNFVGLEYGWYDAVGKSPEPFDNLGHGTHTLGTLVGGNGIGVAPNAKWMSCNVFDGKWLPGEALMDCIQWMACPTLSDGSHPDCSKAPAVVSNSWVVPRGEEDDLKDGILQWRAMGIIPVFAVGNDGMECNKTRPPGELPFVIGVGASTEEDAHFYISSVGPTSDGRNKPDLVAPGDDIWSSYNTEDSEYEKLYGSSMATPHVAAVVALLKVRNPALTYDEAYELLIQNTSPLKFTNFDDIGINSSFLCNAGMGSEKTPNIFWGYGRLDAFKAVQAQTRLISKKK